MQQPALFQPSFALQPSALASTFVAPQVLELNDQELGYEGAFPFLTENPVADGAAHC